MDLETANRALSLSRTTGYALAKHGGYPCTVLRLGNAYRVATAVQAGKALAAPKERNVLVRASNLSTR